ncbi:MAG TPA: hypothetical protein VF733_06020 [Candidatus Saccharimonadales bacterium]
MLGGIIYGVTAFIESLLGLRFLFRVLGANPANGFVDWIYDWSTPFAAPFAGIFGQQATVTGQGTVVQSVFDWTALIAMVVVALIGGILARIMSRLGAERDI